MFFDFSKYIFYVLPGVTDMRKGADSLAQSVYANRKMDVYSKIMFLFCSKNRKTLAVLVWDNGFWLMKKKIYRGIFACPMDRQQESKGLLCF